MKQTFQLGDLQYAIMRVLWDQGEASASRVHGALLEERGLAPTTIATMLTKMEKKGLVSHRSEGRQFIYSPAVPESAVRRSMVEELVERAFEGDAAALVNHLLEVGGIDADELTLLKKSIEKHEREEG